MSAGVVGRDAELASLRDFASRIRQGTAALVLEGDAGVGKSTLWRAGLEAARSQQFHVLSAGPAESETGLSFSGIGDLLDPVLDEALASLSPAQHHALSRALLLGADEGGPPDPHAIGVALLSALRALAGARPVVVAVDDVQWLDPASAAALAYAGRRLGSERVGLLFSRRSGLESLLLTELRRALPGDRVTTVDVGPLDPAALYDVVQSQLGVVLPRPRLQEVHEASGGNPFYALEIVRTLQRRGVSVETGSLTVPESLQDLVHGRVMALPQESRDFLLVVAAHANAPIEVAEAVSGVDSETGLGPARNLRVVEVDDRTIRFTHPLLAAATYQTANRARRREVHARLAELLDDPEACAWQLAASVDAPSATVAAALDEAAGHAQSRGALRSAALMLDRARELTPAADLDDAVQRAVDGAYLHFESGDSRRAEAQLRSLIGPLAPGPNRARATVVLARIRLYEAPDEAAELFARVLTEAGDDRQTLALAHEGLASCCIWRFERFEEQLRHCERAFAIATELGDDALAADVLLSQLGGEALLGRPTAKATAERAEALQAFAEDQRVLDQPLISLSEYWTWVDAHERAREALGDLMRHAADRGDENARPWLCFLLGDLERLRGRLGLAFDLAREGEEAAAQSGQPLFARLNVALQSLVAAQLGRAEARDAAQRALDEAQDNYGRLVASEALAHVALVCGDPDAAVTCLEPRLAFVRKEGIVEPGAIRFTVDLVEALVELGRRNDALAILEWYEGNALRLERPSARANSLRCRGLLAAQDGDLDGALDAFAGALSLHALPEIPLDRARTLLALGSTQRRAKRRREARATLQEALAVFEAIGAQLWAERVRDEIRRISGRAPTAGALTPAEERVAALAAEGKTNSEVAAALFLSDRTVEGHLSRIYGKLGIRHRTELGHALAARQTQGVAPSKTRDTPVSADSTAP